MTWIKGNINPSDLMDTIFIGLERSGWKGRRQKRDHSLLFDPLEEGGFV